MIYSIILRQKESYSLGLQKLDRRSQLLNGKGFFMVSTW